MSTEQVDPQLVEETKAQIRELVNEISQLAKSEMSPQEFYDGFLNRVVSALAAEGGAIWTTNEGNRIELTYQINFVKTGLADNQEDQNRHGKLLAKVLSTGEPMMVPPHSGAGDDDEGANPTPFLLVLGPLMSDQEVKGVIEVFQRPGARSTTQRGYQRFLLQMCDLAGDYLKTRSLRNYTDRQSLWNQLEQFTREVHKSLDPREAAYTIANEGRRLIQCDRVSVAIHRGRRCTIEAVSGQDTFDKRSNTIRLLGKLASAAAATGETVWYTGDTSDMAPQVEDAVQNYVDESHSKTVGVLPLAKPQVDMSDKPESEREPPEVIGALIVEQIEDARVHEGTLQRVEVVRDHSASALANAQEHNNLFLMPLWRVIGKATWVLKARTLPKTLAITGVIVALILALIFVQADFEMEGRGTLQPADQIEIYAPPGGGVVMEVLVEHGNNVKKGQELLRLKNKDLEIAKTDIEKNISTTIAAIAAAISGESSETRSAEKRKLHNEAAQYRIQLRGFQKQLDLIVQKEKDLVVLSPVAGQVMTWDLRDLLMHRPVDGGQVLVKVADLSGEWELEVNLPEDKLGPVKAAQAALDTRRKELQKKLAGTTDPEEQEEIRDQLRGLQATYILATDPGNEHRGYVSEIHGRADVQGQAGSAVRLQIAVNKQDIAERVPGVTATTKIYCGRRSIGYVYLRDPLNALRKLWFSYF